MNKKITVGLFCMLTASMFCKINAQTYQALNVTSGYNADLIADGSGTAVSSTTQSVDSPSNGFVFMSSNFVNGSGVAPTAGLPNSGLINSANTPGLSFQLASYSGNNALKLSNMNDSGTINFGSTPKASKLIMLATTGSGSSVASVVVNFTDGSNQTFTNQSVSDWYGGSSFAIKGIGRASRTSDAIENNVNDPRLYEISMVISSSNQAKNISSVLVTKTSSLTGYLCVFGFSYQVANTCIAPDTVTATNITSNSATVSWAAVPGVSSYELYNSTSSTAPVSSTSPTDTGIATVSKNLTGLMPSTNYNVWVRSNCGGGSVSDWSPVMANFSTSCAAVNTPYSENFDSTTGNIPTCTTTQKINNVTVGGDWSVADATGLNGFSSSVIFVMSYMEDINSWFYTPGINLIAGNTYTLTFDYSNYLTPQRFKVAYGTSPLNTSMTNIIQDYPNLNVGGSTPASFTITPTSSGVYYFGFNSYTAASNDVGAVLLDNVSITTSTLATADVQSINNNVQVYPNPASDYLYIKNNPKNAGIKIFDISGKAVLSLDKAEQKIDVSQLIKGTYVLTIKNTDGTSSSHKFIKK